MRDRLFYTIAQLKGRWREKEAELRRKGGFRTIFDMYDILMDPYYQGFAAQIAFYLILSIIPILIILSEFLGIFDISLELFEEWIEAHMQADGAKRIMSLLQFRTSGAANVLFILVALVASSRAQFALARFTNYTFSGGEHTGRGYIRDRIEAVAVMFVVLVAIGVTMVITVKGDAFIKLILNEYFGRTELYHSVTMVWELLRWPIAFVLILLGVFINYFAATGFKAKLRKLIPGSVLCTVLMLLVTFIFTTFSSVIDSYNLLYGALAVFVSLLIWFYCIAWALGLGAVLNHVWVNRN